MDYKSDGKSYLNQIKKNFKAYKVKLKKVQQNNKNQKGIEVKIHPWLKVVELKNILSQKYGVQKEYIRLFFDNFELPYDSTMSQYHICEKNHPVIFYDIDDGKKNFSIKVFGNFPCPKKCKEIIEKVSHGFAKGLNPQLIEDGTSGTYKLKEATNNDVIGIFKPLDEEPFTPNNQKGYQSNFGSQSFRKGIFSGEATIREVAAYLLDIVEVQDKKNKKYKKNYFDVPPTTFTEVSHPSFNKNNIELFTLDSNAREEMWEMVEKFLNDSIMAEKLYKKNEHFLKSQQYNFIPKKYGSLQKFVESYGIASDYSNTLFSVEEAHKIIILDLRILNCDRNDENILLVKEKEKNKGKKKPYFTLIPIDHALSFPSCLQIMDYELCWTTWEQAEVPFSKKEKDYIEGINILEDMRRLNKVIRLRKNCWKYFRVSNTVLKICAKYDLTPAEIASLMYQTDSDEDQPAPSKIEMIVQRTDRLCEVIKIDKRLRIFSTGGKEMDEKNLKFLEEEKKVEENKDEEKNKEIEKDGKTKDGLNENGKKDKRENILSRKKNQRKSLLLRTTSEPKIGKENASSEDEDEYKKLRSGNKGSNDNNSQANSSSNNNNQKGKNSHKNNIKTSRKSSCGSEEMVFDTPYDQLYFQHFSMFVVELIKKEFPEKYNKESDENNQKEIEFEYELNFAGECEENEEMDDEEEDNENDNDKKDKNDEEKEEDEEDENNE